MLYNIILKKEEKLCDMIKSVDDIQINFFSMVNV
jgi:hypothetical protein